MQDEVLPMSGGALQNFGGWGATLVDSLDTLWIMDLKKEFNDAVAALKHIDFTSCAIARISVFETNIRYLGGLLSAYDLSGRKYKAILRKAVEVGDMLYLAFDTENHMPVPFWFWEMARNGEVQKEPWAVSLADYGSFTLEFTRLSQITGDSKYYDAMARLMDLFEAQQNKTKIPGLWPKSIKPQTMSFSSDTQFTMGALADSMYEYLPKQHLLVNGRTDSYERMYIGAIDAAKEHLFFRALTPNNTKVMFSGRSSGFTKDSLTFEPVMEHLTCFVGGMVGIGAKMFSRDQDLEIARQLTDGCVWAYQAMPLGVMPEIFTVQQCGDTFAAKLPSQGSHSPSCEWTDDSWYRALLGYEPSTAEPESGVDMAKLAHEKMEQGKLPPGIISLTDRRYLLRPEAIESVFIMYRITGDRKYLDAGWNMFQSINKHSKTKIAHAQIKDVSRSEPALEDKMESFWMGETLKYFYLLFSEPDLISLDEFVFNTEAHPFLREKV